MMFVPKIPLLAYTAACCSFASAISPERPRNADSLSPRPVTIAKKDLVRRFDPVTNGQYYNNSTASFYVPATRILYVPFDVGESYAGLIPVHANASEADMQKMFFWFFPTVNPAGKDDIVIWLNGGPGCSSMEGFLQENGPINWRPGLNRPYPNNYAWNKLANTIWVEYPIGTGFSSGPVKATNNDEAAQEFLAFWENLLKNFTGLQNKNIYLTGESYAGVHVPYIGAAMLERNDTTFFNVQGALYYDPVMPNANDVALDHAALPAFRRYWDKLFAFPQSYIDRIEDDSERCGLDRYLNEHLVYPPPERPWPKIQVDGCDSVADFDSISTKVNPCFNPYHIQDTCPILWDVLGYPNPVWTAPGTKIWFNEVDVRNVIHVPQEHAAWAECQGPVYAGAGSDNYNGSEHELRFQTLVERTNNVLVGSGVADYVIQPNTTALAIQMTRWNGKQGFQTAPSDILLLPDITNDGDNIAHWAGGGEQGTTHTERGFTHSTVSTSGHMVPQYAPAVAFRHLEFVLGRVKSLSDGSDFTIPISNSFTWPF